MTGHANDYETAKRKFPENHPWRKALFSEVEKTKMRLARERKRLEADEFLPVSPAKREASNG